MTSDLISAIAEAVVAKLEPKAPARKLYDLKAAAQYLGLPPRSVYKLIRDGKIPRETAVAQIASRFRACVDVFQKSK